MSRDSIQAGAAARRAGQSFGGVAPSSYLATIETRAQIGGPVLDGLLASHLIPAGPLRADDFDAFFRARRAALCDLVEKAIGKDVQRDVEDGSSGEDSAAFEQEALLEAHSEGED